MVRKQKNSTNLNKKKKSNTNNNKKNNKLGKNKKSNINQQLTKVLLETLLEKLK